MNKDEMLQAWEARKTSYATQWKTGLCGAIVADPACCCVSLCCPHCASFVLRKKALYDNLDNYRCCGGFMPCSGRCGESNCPALCLCMEVCCCFGTSVAATRWMIQDELRIQNSACDNCILATMLFLQQLACICQIAACIAQDDTLQQLADLISFIAEVVWWSVCACMQTQHHVQLKERDLAGTGGVPPPQTYPAVPQQGYGQQAYGQPAYGQPEYERQVYAQPQPGGFMGPGGGYPPQSYPPVQQGAPQYPPPGRYPVV